MEKPRSVKKFVSAIMALLICLTSLGGLSGSVIAQAEKQEVTYSEVEVISPYYSEQQITFSDGRQVIRSIINGPSEPLPEYQEEREASRITGEPEVIIADFPSYSWVYGSAAVSAAMIAAYYDRGDYPNLYKGPTNNGVMPLTDTGWDVWYDSANDDYPSNPLVASRNGLDGRTTRGSIDDYWVQKGHPGPDPYVSNGWTEHQYTDAIGDFMKTSQAKYDRVDGSTIFYNKSADDPSPMTCADLKARLYAEEDGTYGRKLFYEARGYKVSECYNQRTDNNFGGFTFEKYKDEIDAGHPVLLNLEGHSVVGIGYDGDRVYIRDTWSSDPEAVYSMPWGGSYLGWELLSVSIVHFAPENAVRISQVYGGGGQYNAIYKKDFIELYNASDSDVDLTGWSVQYTDIGDHFIYNILKTNLSGTIKANSYYLIQQGADSNAGIYDLPPPDAIGEINLSPTHFKLALTNTTELLGGACPTDSSIVDFVGVGTDADCYEGEAPAPSISARLSAFRYSDGCQDTNDNAADFYTGPPDPRNSASSKHYCNGAPPQTEYFNFLPFIHR